LSTAGRFRQDTAVHPRRWGSVRVEYRMQDIEFRRLHRCNWALVIPLAQNVLSVWLAESEADSRDRYQGQADCTSLESLY
jgi:hypothetical protein